jgi:glycosyltransferase involved in cell wall biosynthesis
MSGYIPARALVVIGPEPPPFTGMEVATQALLAELERASIPVVRVDTADAQDVLGNRGQWTFHNVRIATKHLGEALRTIRRDDVGAVYLPIAQEFPALYRDLAFLVIAHSSRKPTVIHLHGGSFNDFFQSRSRVARAVIRRVVGGAALGIVLTDRLRSALECVIPANSIVAVPNGLDLPIPAARAHRRRQHRGPTNVLFFSSLFPSKGLFVFLEALSTARAEGVDLRGTVAGTWPSPAIRDEAQSKLLDLALTGSVEFIGPVYGKEKVALFEDADIFCFPSFYPLEGQPLVVIEAMASGLPVVATAWRGIADTVVDGETGFLVETPSPALIAERLAYLVQNAEARDRFGAAGRSRYEELYTQKAFGDRIVPLLQAVLSNGTAQVTSEQ